MAPSVCITVLRGFHRWLQGREGRRMPHLIDRQTVAQKRQNQPYRIPGLRSCLSQNLHILILQGKPRRLCVLLSYETCVCNFRNPQGRFLPVSSLPWSFLFPSLSSLPLCLLFSLSPLPLSLPYIRQITCKRRKWPRVRVSCEMASSFFFLPECILVLFYPSSSPLRPSLYSILVIHEHLINDPHWVLISLVWVAVCPSSHF